MIRAILFDLDNTLFARDAAFCRYASRLLERREIDSAKRADVLQRMLETDRKHQHRSFDAYGSETTGVCPELGWSTEEYLADYLPGLLAEARPQADVQSMLCALKPLYSMGIITNGGSLRQRDKMRRIEILDFFEPRTILISEEVGARKPDPLIFQTALNVIATDPNEVLFCGDDPRCDISGARNMGMKTCWIWGEHHSDKFPANMPTPDFRLQSIVELPEILASAQL